MKLFTGPFIPSFLYFLSLTLSLSPLLHTPSFLSSASHPCTERQFYYLSLSHVLVLFVPFVNLQSLSSKAVFTILALSFSFFYHDLPLSPSAPRTSCVVFCLSQSFLHSICLFPSFSLFFAFLLFLRSNQALTSYLLRF